MLAIKTILHPTDFSSQAECAFQVARALARDHGAHIILLHVRGLQMVLCGQFGGVVVASGEQEKCLQDRLEQMKRAHEPEVTEVFLAEGDPATEIQALATSKKCDLIVMGTHGRTGLGRVLMGSVAEQVVRNAPCPVLTLKPSPPFVAEVNLVSSPVSVG